MKCTQITPYQTGTHLSCVFASLSQLSSLKMYCHSTWGVPSKFLMSVGCINFCTMYQISKGRSFRRLFLVSILWRSRISEMVVVALSSHNQG